MTEGAGDALNQLSVRLSATSANDYAAVNIGQIKSLAKPFFDRLLQAGYQGHPLESGTYPWVGKESATNDYAMANIGQVKNLFSFDISGFKVLPESWQIEYFGHTGISPDADPDGDGVSNWEEYRQGTNPTSSADSNNNGIPDDWELFHANSFAAWPSVVSMHLSRQQSGTQTLVLNNSTAQPVQYTVALTNNIAQGGSYSFLDSKTGNVPFTWEDISTSGTQFTGNVNSDDGSESVDLGFDFPLYGQTFSSVYVCSNGFLAIGDSSTHCDNGSLPSTSAPHNLIAPLWDNLIPSSGGAVYYKKEAGRLIVQYQDVRALGGYGTYTFQVVLSSDGIIEFRYNNISGDANACTVGIQNSDDSDGLQIACDKVYQQSKMAIRISSFSSFVEVAPLSGTVAAGNQSQLTTTFHALRLAPGNYTANIQITPNSGSSLNIPATLEVINLPSQVEMIAPLDGTSLAVECQQVVLR